MKFFIYIVVALGMTSTFSSAKLINSSSINFDNFETAKKICRAQGGRLPTFNELNRIAQSCGARITKFGANRVSRAFHACVRGKGFNSKTYWTTSRDEDIHSYRIGVNFYNTGRTALSPYNKALIRCVK